MAKTIKNNPKVLGLDVSTKTIGWALFDIQTQELLELTHISPVPKPKPENKIQELLEKAEIFRTKLINYKNLGITKVVIEEPLLQSNNVYTIATLLRFNGMISRSVYDTLGVTPEFISSYDARKYAFPELMAVRRFKKDGSPLNEKQIAKNQPVLFGAYDFNVDKKFILWEKVCELEPQVVWLYDKKNKLKKESFDLSDAYVAGLGFMNKMGFWNKTL